MSELKSIRESKGMKRGFVALRLGVKVITMGAYERGSRELPPRFIRPLAALYGVPVEQIVDAAYPAKAESTVV